MKDVVTHVAHQSVKTHGQTRPALTVAEIIQVEYGTFTFLFTQDIEIFVRYSLT